MTETTIVANKSGWTRFCSFIPEFMIGMSNRFYSFKNGNMYLHDAGETNTFYEQAYVSKLKTVLNADPSVRKLFKSISLNGTDAWAATLTTDIQYYGTTMPEFFQKKEGVWFAYARDNSGVNPELDTDNRSEFVVRNANGLGDSTDISLDPDFPSNHYIIKFDNVITPAISVGDAVYLYDADPEHPSPKLVGVLEGVYNDPITNKRCICAVDSTGMTNDIVSGFYMCVKNQYAESSGILGQYCIVELEVQPGDDMELFLIDMDVMKSYP